MNGTHLLIATRSADKLLEIRQILGFEPEIVVRGLVESGIRESPVEEDLEHFATFEANAASKARFFAERAGCLTLADDSGLCVDALGGAPGVRSKRFSGRTDLQGVALDLANNQLLLARLAGIPAADRTARYVCAVAVAVPPGGVAVFRGTSEGLVLEAPRGSSGFGYDPLFLLPSENATFAELSAEQKNRLSHRARAVRRAVPELRRALDRNFRFD